MGKLLEREGLPPASTMRTLEVNDDERRLMLDALVMLEGKLLDDLMVSIPGTIKEQRLKSDKAWVRGLKAKVG